MGNRKPRESSSDHNLSEQRSEGWLSREIGLSIIKLPTSKKSGFNIDSFQIYSFYLVNVAVSVIGPFIVTELLLAVPV